MRTIRWAAVSAAALLLAGCASGSSSAEVEASAPAAGVEETATVKQYASTISEQHAFVDAWLSAWDELGCKSTDLSDDPTCSMSATTGGLRAAAAGLSINELSDDTADGYAGSPPAEIADLYESTLAAAQSAEDAGRTYISELDCPDDDECPSALLKIHGAMRTLKGEFSKWTPYY